MNIRKRNYLKEKDKEHILLNLYHVLYRETPVVFAYTHGSFQNGKGFNDIDLAVFVDEDKLGGNNDLFDYEINLAGRTDLAIPGYSIDLRLLNTAPLSFRYRVVNTGTVFLCKDEKKRISFVTKTRDSFFDFEPHRRLLYQVLVLGRK
jgi:predicted nucleotidyltransferase